MIYAKYKGKDYLCAILNGGKTIRLISNVPVDGFFNASLSFIKEVDRNKCEKVFKNELYFEYNGDEFLVKKVSGYNVLLESAEQNHNLTTLGFDEIENNVFQKWVHEADGTYCWKTTEC